MKKWRLRADSETCPRSHSQHPETPKYTCISGFQTCACSAWQLYLFNSVSPELEEEGRRLCKLSQVSWYREYRCSGLPSGWCLSWTRASCSGQTTPSDCCPVQAVSLIPLYEGLLCAGQHPKSPSWSLFQFMLYKNSLGKSLKVNTTISPNWMRNEAGQRLIVFSRKCTGHSKHPLPTTQENTLHMDITRWSTPKSDWLYSFQPKMQKLYTVSKNKTRSWLWLRS